MNLLTKMQGKFFAQRMGEICKRTINSSRSPLIGECLTDRTLIRIQGSEVIPYLQGLITNDMTNFSRGSNIIYTMLLNNSGRVMYDTLIYQTGEPDVFLVECDKLVMNAVKRHLRLYRVRRKIEVESVATEYSPWVVFHAPKKNQENGQSVKTFGEQKPKSHKISGGGEQIIVDLNNADFSVDEIIACQDPRIRALGFRVVMPKTYSFQQLSKLFCHQKLEESTPATSYRYLRYRLGIGEGVQDHPINKCFPLESNCDFLHGVSFNKGCYVGQELTARVYHTGVIRKRLMPLTITNKVEEGTKSVQSVGGTVVGSIRGFENDACLALLRVEQVMKMPNLMIDGDPCKVIVPDWWPKEQPEKHTAKKTQVKVV